MGPRTGKQIAVAMTERDERDFLAFVRASAQVQILALDSPSPDAVWLDQLPPRRTKDRLSRRFALWSQAFAWQPAPQVRTHDAVIFNIAHAPVIHYDRHPFAQPSPDGGRLYWARDLTGDPPGNTNAALEPWWNAIEQWVQAHGHHRTGTDSAVHYLPWAWWQFGKWGRG